MEALAPMFERGTDPNLDGVPIHPLVARERWRTRLGKHLAIYPIRRGNDGFWHVSLLLLDSSIPSHLVLECLRLLISGHDIAGCE